MATGAGATGTGTTGIGAGIAAIGTVAAGKAPAGFLREQAGIALMSPPQKKNPATRRGFVGPIGCDQNGRQRP